MLKTYQLKKDLPKLKKYLIEKALHSFCVFFECEGRLIQIRLNNIAVLSNVVLT